jgi:hypothetical protein
LTRRVSRAVGKNFVGDGTDILREKMREGFSETQRSKTALLGA